MSPAPLSVAVDVRPWAARLRASALLDAADLAKEQAWAWAINCPPWSREARTGARAAVRALTEYAETLRVLAAIELEGRP